MCVLEYLLTLFVMRIKLFITNVQYKGDVGLVLLNNVNTIQ